MPKYKKTKAIKAPEYDESLEYDIEVEDDSYEDEFSDPEVEYTKIEDAQTFSVTEEDEIPEYEDAEKTFKRSNTERFMKIFNIFFVIAIILMLIIAIDVIAVARYHVGPFFAIKTKTYNDGGTKEYYGIGYKVIKYNQNEGRKDIQIGLWSMEYIAEPTPIEDVDLAIEFQNNPEETSKKYYNQYLEITSRVKKIDKKNNKLVLQYTDPDGKYTLRINCSMAAKKKELASIKEDQELIVKGTVSKFTLKTKNKSNTVYLSDCFIK